MSAEKAIVVVSFGTTVDQARRESIESIEWILSEKYPEYTVRRAFTSTIVRKKLFERGIRVPGLPEVLEELEKEHYTDVFVLPTHIIPGIEYDRIREQAEKWNNRFTTLKVGEPLLFQKEDLEIVSGLLQKRFPAGQETVYIFMGHGTTHAANSVYERLERKLEKEKEQCHYVAAVEGVPTLDDIIEKISGRAEIHRVILVPFMLTAGDHARHDMAGDEPDSWKSRLKQSGYQVSCVMSGLGSYPEIREIYVKKCRKLLRGTFYGISVGPGAGGNITLDAVKQIRECDVLAVPRTNMENTTAFAIVEKGKAQLGSMFGASDYMRLKQKEIVYLDFLMTRDIKKRQEVYRKQTAQIEAYLQQGKNVGMIILGDASVYATVSYLAGPIREDGYAVVILPGVSSFCAAAAALGRSLTDMNKPLHIIPAGCEDVEEQLLLCGSKVIMKSAGRLPEIKQSLRNIGLYEKAGMVKDCGMETQEICPEMDDDSLRNSYFTTIIIPCDEED